LPLAKASRLVELPPVPPMLAEDTGGRATAAERTRAPSTATAWKEGEGGIARCWGRRTRKRKGQRLSTHTCVTALAGL
jgi:hypothetical protein